jgi:hypothetical protein
MKIVKNKEVKSVPTKHGLPYASALQDIFTSESKQPTVPRVATHKIIGLT